MKREIIAISAKVPSNKKVYVRSLDKRELDNLQQVTTTFNPDEAKDFGTVSNAKTDVKTFFNPFEREFTPERLSVNKTRSFANQSSELA